MKIPITTPEKPKTIKIPHSSPYKLNVVKTKRIPTGEKTPVIRMPIDKSVEEITKDIKEQAKKKAQKEFKTMKEKIKNKPSYYRPVTRRDVPPGAESVDWAPHPNKPGWQFNPGTGDERPIPRKKKQ